MNNPQHMREWKVEGGDPCGEVWMGISCSGSSLVDLQLRGLKLLRSLGNNLQDLHNLKNLDVSFNNLQCEIPYGLPPNATHLNMACKNLTQTILFSLTSLQSLDASFNNLQGEIPYGLPPNATHLNMGCKNGIHLMTSLQSLNVAYNNLTQTILLFSLPLMTSLQSLDASFNNLQGEIPYGLPSNATHLNLACKNLTQTILFYLPLMTSLQSLNLSNNSLSGPLGNVFPGLLINEIDLSFIHLKGDLFSSCGSLMNLTSLYLQNNRLTGSVICLMDLPLVDLNIEDSQFSGIIPSHFQSIPHLRIWGRECHSRPWKFPLDVRSNATGYPTQSNDSPRPEKKSKGIGEGCTFLVVGGLVLLIAVRMSHRRAQNLFGKGLAAFGLGVAPVVDAADQIPSTPFLSSLAFLAMKCVAVFLGCVWLLNQVKGLLFSNTATKTDIAEASKRTKQALGEIKTDIESIKAELKADLSSVDNKISGEIAGVKET